MPISTISCSTSPVFPSTQDPGSGAGLDQLQHLGTDAASSAFTVESGKDLPGGTLDISLSRRQLSFGLQSAGPGLPFAAIDGGAGVRHHRPPRAFRPCHRLHRCLAYGSQDHEGRGGVRSDNDVRGSEGNLWNPGVPGGRTPCHRLRKGSGKAPTVEPDRTSGDNQGVNEDIGDAVMSVTRLNPEPAGDDCWYPVVVRDDVEPDADQLNSDDAGADTNESDRSRLRQVNATNPNAMGKRNSQMPHKCACRRPVGADEGTQR